VALPAFEGDSDGEASSAPAPDSGALAPQGQGHDSLVAGERPACGLGASPRTKEGRPDDQPAYQSTDISPDYWRHLVRDHIGKLAQVILIVLCLLVFIWFLLAIAGMAPAIPLR
jgi:hypothetical protein